MYLKLKDFFIFDSKVKKYLLMILGLLMLIFFLIFYIFKGLECDFVFLLVISYFVIFFLIKNERFPLFPSIVESSSNVLVLSRFMVLTFCIFIIILLSIQIIIE